LDPTGQPTQNVIETRRRASFITPIPKPKKRKGKATTKQIIFDEAEEISTSEQKYETESNINFIRECVDRWRGLPESKWNVKPQTARLLRHWRHFSFNGVRPFFCQVEAAETAIWLSEVAPQDPRARDVLDRLKNANHEANPELFRIALKLATGAGKTTVMAMLIAWQAVNAAHHPGSKQFSKGFLIVTPGLTIKDRLRVLQPNDLENYYGTRELVPNDMLRDVMGAKIVITNYHAFKLRETQEMSAGNRAFLQGRGDPLDTRESEGQMIRRVMSELMGMKNVVVINDEAHHCYREKPDEEDDEELKGDDR
jgi:type III restriction enzyme